MAVSLGPKIVMHFGPKMPVHPDPEGEDRTRFLRETADGPLEAKKENLVSGPSFLERKKSKFKMQQNSEKCTVSQKQ